MRNHTMRDKQIWRDIESKALCMFALGLVVSTAAFAASVDDARKLMEASKYSEAITMLSGTISDNPADETARTVLAEAYEKSGKLDEALGVWKDILKLSNNEERLHEARKAVSRIRRIKMDQTGSITVDGSDTYVDPFFIPMPEVDWNGLEKVEDSKYIPSPFPEFHPYDVPPFVYETEHFTVYSANERYSKLVGDRAEIYLRFMLDKLFAGRDWAVRFPIIAYTTYDDYVSHGAPQGTGGVTAGHVTGKTTVLLFYQIDTGRRRGGGGEARVWRYGLESVLPHELTHAILNEFFQGKRPPQWLHEAVAGRFEQTREHYFEAARLARFVVGGEYFRMRDLFEQVGYPERISLFYEQSAIVVLYLFETGPEAMNAFLTELAAGHDPKVAHDKACSAALGIPEEGAVEEFEKRWVEWMRRRYIKDLDRAKDKTQMAEAGPSKDKVFLPWVNELETTSSISDWRTVDLGSMDAFSGVGQSKSDWSTSGGVLKCEGSKRGGSSILGIRMNEVAPVAISFDVRSTDNSAGQNVFGLTQLDANGQDTRIEVSAKLPDTSTHSVVALWSDDLALYVDGVCTGRYPAHQVRGNEQEVNYPLAFVAYGPVEIQNIKIASIKKFSDKPLVASAEEEKKNEEGGGRRRRGESRRNHGVPSGTPGG